MYTSLTTFSIRDNHVQKNIFALDSEPSQLGWNSPYEREQANHLGLVGLHLRRGGFHVLDARQSDFDHVLGRGIDPRRDRANTAEDRILATGFGEVFQDPLPGRGRARRRGQLGRRNRGSCDAAVKTTSKCPCLTPGLAIGRRGLGALAIGRPLWGKNMGKLNRILWHFLVHEKLRVCFKEFPSLM
jgi:hypothetical protein